MDDRTLTLSIPKHVRLRRHPLAGAVMLSLLGSTLVGCASGGPPKGTEAVKDARSAFAREDFNKAAHLLAIPAMQGDAEAQYALGYMYYYGKGVRKDQRRAYAWFEDVARLGHAGAQRALKLLKVYAQAPALSSESPTDPATASTGQTPPAASGAKASPRPVTAVPAPTSEAPPTEASRASEPSPTPVRQVEVAPDPAAEPAALPGEQPASASVQQDQGDAETGASESEVMMSPPAAPSAEPASAPAAKGLHSAQAPVTRAPPTATDGSQAARPSAGTVKAVWSEGPHVTAAYAPALQHTALTAASVSSPPENHNANSAGAPPRYTVHLLSSRRRGDLIRLVETHGLEQAGYYVVKRADGQHYRLVYGGFQTVAAARRAIDALPPALYAHRPWVNNFPAGIDVTRFRPGSL